MAQGPHAELLARSRRPARSRRSRTSIPPQSPVAWSSFITGLDPGGHGIFDFVHRDPHTMVPYLSTTRTEPAATHAHDRQLAVAALERARDAPARRPAVLGRARAARRAHDDHPHAGELPAVRHGDARAERHGDAGHSRHLRHVLVLLVGAGTARRKDRVRRSRVAGGRRRQRRPGRARRSGQSVSHAGAEGQRAVHGLSRRPGGRRQDRDRRRRARVESRRVERLGSDRVPVDAVPDVCAACAASI